ncbi:hypothetical protein LCGC14_2486310 [marine sediment metagenome]|uniref:Uncharacterized protein n=1 Tax=marine sediment metagenome TaxID=412755 RepID=A0A0F9BTY4_9ZZZZ
MEDYFHLFEINKRLVNLIYEASSIASVSEKYIIEPTLENGEKIIKNIEALEENLGKVKESLVKMVNSIDDNNIIGFKETEDGFELE